MGNTYVKQFKFNAEQFDDSNLVPSGEQIFFNSPPTGDNGGAHALVAGTNGSGKSETLLTLILSLALRYSPEEVNFLVIVRLSRYSH